MPELTHPELTHPELTHFDETGASRMVDVSLGRRSWRAFQVLKADTEYEKGVTFSAGSLISMWLFWPG